MTMLIDREPGTESTTRTPTAPVPTNRRLGVWLPLAAAGILAGALGMNLLDREPAGPAAAFSAAIPTPEAPAIRGEERAQLTAPPMVPRPIERIAGESVQDGQGHG